MCIMLIPQRFRRLYHLHARYLQAFALETSYYLAQQSALHGVRFEQHKRAFHMYAFS